ncbi:hypothetical protein JVT61DRAFT_2642 [Boletus reticuloceps]|uniref:Uncharacterized protein n=1 Tax=Boletus reticuloceps TaxID=495285 RepID=A0A8I2YPN4_9AGAM|nr:hypothetical protein JVT61DRAFT_2642 [Boletus reticuloceps]
MNNLYDTPRTIDGWRAVPHAVALHGTTDPRFTPSLFSFPFDTLTRDDIVVTRQIVVRAIGLPTSDPTSDDDLEYVINHVFFALKEPVIVKEAHDRDPETALRTFIDPVYAAAYAYYEYVDDFHKLQWYHIVQMLGDLRCRYLSEEYPSQLCGMRPGGTVSCCL